MRRKSLYPRIGLALAAVVLGSSSYLLFREAVPSPASTPAISEPLPAIPDNPSEAELAAEAGIRLYQKKVAIDPGDTRSQDALAEYYLQLVRITGNEDYLPLARKAAGSSMATVPWIRNKGGLMALAHTAFSNHQFQEARDAAQKILQLDPENGEAYATLGEAYLELGDYPAAEEAYAKMQNFASDNPGTETRLARLALLRGQVEESRAHLQRALVLLGAARVPSPETVAWCQWQLGDLDFSLGNYPAAEKLYRTALQTSPGYFRALYSLGRVRAAQGDLAGAIACTAEVARVVPTLPFMAALSDLYQLAGNEQAASAQYDLARQMGEHSRLVHNLPFDRNLALFLADHDADAEKAYQLALAEYRSGRYDIYGVDAVAWTACKAGHLAEARTAMKEALRLGTRDARLLYHAGIIALRRGDKAAGQELLQRALALNPAFDPWQSRIASETLRSP